MLVLEKAKEGIRSMALMFLSPGVRSRGSTAEEEEDAMAEEEEEEEETPAEEEAVGWVTGRREGEAETGISRALNCAD